MGFMARKSASSKLWPNTIRAIERALHKGGSLAETAKRLGVSTAVVHKYQKALIEPPEPKEPPMSTKSESDEDWDTDNPSPEARIAIEARMAEGHILKVLGATEQEFYAYFDAKDRGELPPLTSRALTEEPDYPFDPYDYMECTLKGWDPNDSDCITMKDSDFDCDCPPDPAILKEALQLA